MKIVGTRNRTHNYIRYTLRVCSAPADFRYLDALSISFRDVCIIAVKSLQDA
jgi:hypothetical protein